MKFNCGPTREEKVEKQKLWHPWFAWWPVRVGKNDCRWLEIVERRRRYYYSTCEMEYRALDYDPGVGTN